MIETPVITIDVDWVPDFIIDHVDNILTEKQVKATWFVTHKSPILEKLQNNSLFELGIHPNFKNGSTHGDNPDSILRYMKKILPNAKSVRTHDLFQTTRLISEFHKYGIENDVSLLLPKVANLMPFYSKYLQLYRFPFFWEDDICMPDETSWSIKENYFKKPGLKIFNFHPLYIYLNSINQDDYYVIRDKIGIPDLTEKNISNYINRDTVGTGTLFDELVRYLSDKETYTIMNLRAHLRNEIENQ